MLKKVLIANRGEIAVRIIRTCREMGIRTVAVYSTADRAALHVRLADEAWCIGAAPAAASYLNQAALLAAARAAGADAVHPGYGFLAENADFAELCAQQGLIFIGPSPEAIRRMGDKDTARQTMLQAGVPVVPGTDHLIETAEEAVSEARRIGYPVLVKATAGGGGKGMKEAADENELRRVFPQARQEAAAAFGDSGVYLEKYLQNPRHIEVQLAADNYGHVVCLSNRDCSVQRRHQKLVEEAPAAHISDSLRHRMEQAAVAAAQAVQYSGAGTVEFLVEYNKFYFLEMNTRVQVEHPVTEWVTGVDIVALQLMAAAGDTLPLLPKDIRVHGCALECRINAEDPAKNFLPSPGKITRCRLPGGFGVRVDSAAYPGYTIPPYYDSLIAKIIVWGRTREEAIRRMQQALGEMEIAGVQTTAAFQLAVISHPAFIQGDFDTGFLTKHPLEF